MTERFALYFSPDPGSQLGQFGNKVLQRTPTDPRDSHASSPFHDENRWRSLTKKASHYGFHATLKAPFELNKNTNEERVIDIALALSLQLSSIPLTTLKPRQIASFAALTLSETVPALQELAFRCVKAFEDYRQPLSNDDRNRRLQSSLSPRQIELMDQYGYPYVDDEFRFHMTLSSRLDKTDKDYVDWLSMEYEQTVSETPALDRLSVFKQLDRQAAFIEIAAFQLDNKAPSR